MVKFENLLAYPRSAQRTMFVISAVIAIAILGILLQIRFACGQEKRNWEFHRWHSIHWIKKTENSRKFDLYLFAPPALDTQARIVFLRNALKGTVRSNCNGARYEIMFKNYKLRRESKDCFNYNNIISSLLDINMHDINLQEKRTIISFNVTYGMSSEP